MIDRMLFVGGMGELERYFKFNILNDDSKLNAWYNRFSDENPEVFRGGIEHFIDNSKFEPTVAGLRDSMMAYCFPYLPSAEEEYEKIMRIIRNYPHGKERGESCKDLIVITKRVLDGMGGITGFSRANNTQILKSQFVNAFNDLLNSSLKRSKNSKVLTIGMRENLLPLEISLDANDLLSESIKKLDNNQT